MAHIIRSQVQGRPLPSGKELLEGFASLETDYFQYGAGMELLGKTYGYTQGTNSGKDVGSASARLIGSYLSGLVRFIKPMKDVLSQFDTEEATLRDFSENASGKFLKEISRSVPGVGRLANPTKDALTGENVVGQFPIGRMVGANIVHPTFLAAHETPATEWANKLFKYTPTGEWTEDERKAFYIRKRLKNAVYRDEVKPQDLNDRINEFVKNGKLTPQSAKTLKSDLELSELQVKLKYGYKPGKQRNPEMDRRLQEVLSRATETEKKDIQKVIGRRMAK